MHRTGVHKKDSAARAIIFGVLSGTAAALALAALAAALIARGTVGEALTEQLALVCAALGSALAALVTNLCCDRRLIQNAAASGLIMYLATVLAGLVLGSGPLAGQGLQRLAVMLIAAVAVGAVRALGRSRIHRI